MREYSKDAQHFQDITGVRLHCDGMLTAFLGKKQVDLPKVDAALMHRYPEYSGDGKASMRSFITKKFGAEIMEILDYWTNLDE